MMRDFSNKLKGLFVSNGFVQSWRKEIEMRKCYVLSLILALTIVVLSGCGKTSTENQTRPPEFEVSKIDVNLDLGQDEQEILSYSDGKEMVFLVQKKERDDDLVTGVSAERFIIYDIADGSVADEYVMDKDVYGKMAIPYKDGLLYSCYEVDRGSKYRYHWQIIYQSGSEKTVIDQGKEGSGFQASLLAQGDVLYYTFKDRTDGYQCGIRKWEDGKTATIAEYNDMYKTDLLRVDGGICYTRMWNDDSIGFSAAEEGKILWVQKADSNGAAVTSGMTDNYILYYENGLEEKGLRAIDIKTGKVIKGDIELKEPRITSIGNYFLIEDDNKNQYYCKVDDGQIVVKKLELPEEQEYQIPLDYGIPAGKDGVIFRGGDYWNEEREYFLLKLL